MPVYFSPGVYVEEVPGTPPIAGVGTSTAAFIGVVDPAATNPAPPASDGKGFVMPFRPGRPLDPASTVAEDFYELAPENEPQLVTNFEQFKTKFGDFHTANKTLAHAVFGFFNNGGTRAHVVRVDDLGKATSVANALKKLEPIDEVAIVAAPGALKKPVRLMVIEHCENMKDRFAIIDGQKTTDITVDAIKGPEAPPNDLKNSDFAGMYFPWIQVFDPITSQPDSVPPSGHMAGIYARVDAERGVHKAPANVGVRGALGLEYLVSKNEQDGLNPAGINVIRSFNGDIRVWGARTLGGDLNGEFKYINVRRLMNFLRESIEEGTNFVVFEPNSPALWQRIIRSVTGFLTTVWRDGALFGTTPEEAFFVKCDETTNPPEVRELGQVVTEIGVAIVKPAEFVIFRISQLTGPPA
jgi:phage tail sheath protein FI